MSCCTSRISGWVGGLTEAKVAGFEDGGPHLEREHGRGQLARPHLHHGLRLEHADAWGGVGEWVG